MKQFSTHCIRDFKSFIGELTAASAGIHVALQFTKSTFPSGLTDPWENIAKQFGVCLSGIDSDAIIQSAARLNIVNVYSGFDLYLSAYRKMFIHLNKLEWKSKKEDSPFEEFKKNIAFDFIGENIGLLPKQIDLVDYYRFARNAIVHPSEDAIKAVKNYFKNKQTSLNDVKNHYRMVSAPNSFDEINFHDVKLFARVLLDILPKFDEALDPGDQKLKELLPLQCWSTLKGNRKENAIVGYLTNHFGISKERAINILVH